MGPTFADVAQGISDREHLMIKIDVGCTLCRYIFNGQGHPCSPFFFLWGFSLGSLCGYLFIYLFLLLINEWEIAASLFEKNEFYCVFSSMSHYSLGVKRSINLSTKKKKRIRLLKEWFFGGCDEIRL